MFSSDLPLGEPFEETTPNRDVVLGQNLMDLMKSGVIVATAAKLSFFSKLLEVGEA